ncbi:GAF domain-containing protein [Paenibacillus marinisediminis]
MEGIIKGMLDKLPPWSYQMFAIVICAGLIFYFVRTLYINKKFSDMVTDIMKRDDRMQTYQDKVDKLQVSRQESEHSSQQMLSALRNLRTFMDTLNDLRQTDDCYVVLTETGFLMQRMLDMLAIDMKLKPGGHHRCGIWLHGESMLTMRFASAGFPKHYVGERTLHVDRSVAGRSYRKQAIVHSPEVRRDEDWELNPDSKSPYQTLLCMPLSDYGVLTIDGLEPFPEAGRAIGEMYAAFVTGVLTEHTKAFSHWAKSVSEGNPALGIAQQL